MKNYEIKKIGAGSVFKFYFAFGVVIGLIVSLVLVFTGTALNSIGAQLGTANFNSGPLQIGAIILGVVIGSLVYGLITGVIGAIGAWVYNLFAALVGGIVVKLVDRE